ncbi:hypothetical protein K474DRAFT_1604461, partial [Panus rudis PR-1116 ss-1]
IAASTAVNCGIFGATFFSIREYAVSPIFLSTIPWGQFPRRLRELEARKQGQDYVPDKLSWWDMRAHKVPDTALSGALTGGILNAWKRGRPGIFPGISTGGIVCTILQLAYNEVGILRVKYVSRRLRESAKQDTTPLTSPSLSPAPSSPLSTSTPEAKATEAAQPTAEPRPWTDRVFTLFGLTKVSDEEYLERLQRERDAHLRRIAVLEKEKASQGENTASHSA